MQSRKIRERLCELFIGESLSKLRTACESLQNQFRPRKLVKVFVRRMLRTKAKTHAAKVLRKELAKEEPIRTNSRSVLNNAQLHNSTNYILPGVLTPGIHGIDALSL